MYEEKLDENLVKKDGTLYRRVKKTVIDAALSQPYYIHKLDLRVPVTESAGYSVELYLDGKRQVRSTAVLIQRSLPVLPIFPTVVTGSRSRF